MSVPSRILLIGATGVIGRYITDAVVAARPAFPHISIFTSAHTAASKAELLQRWTAAGNVSVVVGDITNEADIRGVYAREQPDTVVSCLGRGALAAQTKLIQLADAPGSSVQWLFPSEYGTDIAHNPRSATEPTHQVKLAIRQYIREHVKRLQVTYLVTGPYFDMWVTPHGDGTTGGFDVARRVAHLIDGGEGRIGFCTMPDVGKFLVASLRHPAASFGQALKVQSFVVTPNQVLAEYKKQTGGAWTVQNTSLAALKELEAKQWADKNPAATGATLRRIWAEGGTLYAKNDNDVIGVQDKDLDSLETAVRVALSKGV